MERGEAFLIVSLIHLDPREALGGLICLVSGRRVTQHLRNCDLVRQLQVDNCFSAVFYQQIIHQMGKWAKVRGGLLMDLVS